MQTTLNFYELNEENGFLSNYYESEFEIDGEKWKTVEHYFQA